MAKGRSRKPELWIMAVEQLRQHGSGIIDPAIWFFALLAPLHAVFFQVYRPLAWASSSKEPIKWAIAWPSLAVMIVMGVVVFVQAYFFQAYFLQRDPLVKAPKIAVANFFYCAGKCLQLLLIFMAVITGLILIGALMGLVCRILGMNERMVETIAQPVSLLLGLVVVYVFLRYSLFLPLAVSRIESGLKKSWILTKGNMWRLVVNYLLLFVMTAVPMGFVNLSYFACLGDAHGVMLTPPQIWVTIVFTGVWAAVQAVVAALFASFHCVCCRTFAKEKRQSDTSFSLTTSK